MVIEVAIFVFLEVKIDEVDASIDRRIARSVLFGVFIGKFTLDSNYSQLIYMNMYLSSAERADCLWHLCALSHAEDIYERESCAAGEHCGNIGYVSAYQGLKVCQR